MRAAPRVFKRICVFCGTGVGDHPVYRETAQSFGRFLAERRIGVVYGGARLGLMGAVADGALDAGGEVIGVIPGKLQDLELAHTGLSELIVVDGMHPRKATMARLADAFVALPGGFGTLEELFEVTTWAQLNDHDKPVGLYDVRGYYRPLIAFLDHAATVGFIRPLHRPLITDAEDAETLLTRLAVAEIPELSTWVPRR